MFFQQAEAFLFLLHFEYLLLEFYRQIGTNQAKGFLVRGHQQHSGLFAYLVMDDEVVGIQTVFILGSRKQIRVLGGVNGALAGLGVNVVAQVVNVLNIEVGDIAAFGTALDTGNTQLAQDEGIFILHTGVLDEIVHQIDTQTEHRQHDEKQPVGNGHHQNNGHDKDRDDDTQGNDQPRDRSGGEFSFDDLLIVGINVVHGNILFHS